MNLPYFIARRYLFSKKSHHTINIISWISVVGVAVTTMALICVMSVFNGFQDLVASCFTNFDPQLKVTPIEGKTFSLSDPVIGQLRADTAVMASSAMFEEKALVRYQEHQTLVTLLGVDDDWQYCTDIDSILYGRGRFALHADVLQFGIPGIRLARDLGLTADFRDPIQVYAPRPGEVSQANPTESFNTDDLNSTGLVFDVSQRKYDQSYLLCSLGFTQQLFEKPGAATALALRLRPDCDEATVQARLQSLTGDRYRVANRYEQQDDVFSIMRIEKVMAYVFFLFILLTASFNIVGSLAMLIIDKRQDIRTLRDMGANQRTIQRIFLFEGRMISLFGALLGLIIGLALCYIQQEYGIVKLGSKEDAFIVNAYPVSIRIMDIFVVLLTVLLTSFLTSWYPVRYLSQKLTDRQKA